MGESERRPWGLELARVAALTLALALHALVVVALVETWSTPEILRRDYHVLWDAGRRLLTGELAGIYDARPGGFPFLHPPPVITLSTPLGMLSERGAFVALTLASIAALAGSMLALRRLARNARELDLASLIVLASAPWSIALVLGQPAALFLAAFLVGLATLDERPRVAGLAWSVLLLKPQLAIAPLAFVLVARKWRSASTMMAGALALAVVSLPAGLARWPEWVGAIARTTGEVSSARIVLWKQHTWLAWLVSVVPDARLAWIGWALVAVPLGVATLALAARAPSPLRTGALLALATIALAPYAYFYDALLLAVPAAALVLERASYPRRLFVALAIVATATFATEHACFFGLQRGPAVAGLLVTVWLALELAAARALGAADPLRTASPP